MAGWVDRQIDKWFDRRVDRYVDKKFDEFLKGEMPDEDFQQLKAMTRKGQPLDEETEARLREQLGEAFEPSKTIHNGVARFERTEAAIDRITGYLP